MVQGVDPDLRPFTVVGEGSRRNHPVVLGGQPRVVDLHDQPRIGNRPVFVAQRLGEGEIQLPLVAVILVMQVRKDAGRRHDRQEAPGSARFLDGSRQRVDIALEGRCAAIPDRSGDEPASVGAARLQCGVIPVVEILEAFVVVAVRGIGPGFRPWNRAMVESGDALQHIAVPARLAILAVTDDVDADRCLPVDYVVDGNDKSFAEFLFVIVFPSESGAHEFDQLGRAHQAADMGCLNAIGVLLHRPIL